MQDWVYNFSMAYSQTLRGESPVNGSGASEGIQAGRQTQARLRSEQYSDQAIQQYARQRGGRLYSDVWLVVYPLLQRRGPEIEQQQSTWDYPTRIRFRDVYRDALLQTSSPSGIGFIARGGYRNIEEH
jgi:hypothetical protein